MPYLQDERRLDVFANMAGIVRNLNASVLSINGPENHVHMLIRLPASLSVAKTVEIVKTNSSRWIHEQSVLHRTFAWQGGYAAFSVSESQLDHLSRYIRKEHHRRVSFQEELIAFLERIFNPTNDTFGNESVAPKRGSRLLESTTTAVGRG
jgi:REP element-mobilizing transposase RayT